MTKQKNKLVFTAFLIFAISSICANCGYIRNSEKLTVPSERFPIPSERGPVPAVHARGLSTAPSVETRHVVPETYFQNGRFQPLHVGPPMPVTVDTEVVRGGFIKVTLNAVNKIVYEIAYNNADGWVSDVRPAGQTQYTGTPDQMATEAKLKNIIANSQQIAFEKDGDIQFITDNGSSRVTFDRLSGSPSTPPTPTPFGTPPQPQVPASPPHPGNSPPHPGHPGHPGDFAPGTFSFNSQISFSAETRHAVPATYFHNGQFQTLYDGPPFPITVGTHIVQGGLVKVTLQGVNTIDYEIKYNSADGSVNNVRLIGETQNTGTSDQMSTEVKVKNIIAKCQQIAFEKDGRIQFITDNGSTRVSFDRVVDTARSQETPVVETRHVVPETYFQNNRFRSLFAGAPYPITVDTSRRDGNSLIVTLRAYNIFQYELMVNDQGGVSKVTLMGETHMYGDLSKMAAGTKLKNIIANCQQVAFDKDGSLQFIADYGSSRVTFMA